MDSAATNDASLRPFEYLVRLNGAVIRVYCPPGLPVEINGRPADVQFEPGSGGIGSIEVDGIVYRIAFENDRREESGETLLINGRRVIAAVEDRRSLLRRRMRATVASEGVDTTIRSPMPGLVLKILVRPGQEVRKGDGMIVLEAMKMENEVRSDRSGLVESILVAERAAVEKGAPLLRLK